jgi:hypothetical protein
MSGAREKSEGSLCERKWWWGGKEGLLVSLFIVYLFI